MDIPLLSRMDAVAEYFIDEVETLKGFDLPEEERDAVKSRFYRMYETKRSLCVIQSFPEAGGISGASTGTVRKKSFVMRMCIRFCI